MHYRHKRQITAEEIFPHALDEIAAWQLFPGVYAVGNLHSDRYVCVPESKLSVTQDLISRFDGSSSLAVIADSSRTKNNINVLPLYSALRDAGLLRGASPRGELQRLAVLLWNWPLERICQSIRGFTRAWFPAFAYLSGATVVIGLALIVANWEYLSSLAGQARMIHAMILFPAAVLAVLFSILLHECGHAAAALRYGLVPSGLQVIAYLGVIPMFLIRIPGKYTILPAQRIYLWLAGPWMNLVLASLGMIIIRFSAVGYQARCIVASVVTGNLIFAAANLVPLLPNDGYFVLCTLLRRPNLRRAAYREIRGWIQSRRPPSVGILCYGVLSASALILIFYRNVLRLSYVARHSLLGCAVVIALLAGVTLRWWQRQAHAGCTRGRTTR